MAGSTGLERTIDRVDAAITRVARIRSRPWWAAIIVGLACASVFVGVRVALSAFYGEVTGFMILLPAVILASLAAGRLAGLTAVFACLIGGWLAVGMQVQGAGIRDQLGQVATFNFVVVGVFAAVVAAALRKVLGRLDASLTALRQTDARARASENQLKAMVDQASAGIARVGLDGRIISANARFAQILGLPVDQVIGTTTTQVSHPDDVEPTLKALQASLAGGEGLVEKRYIRPDGEIVWAITSLRALTAADGQVIGHIAVVVDITTAKAAEAALRESEARFRLMADTAPSPVWMTNPEAEVEFVNQALVEFYGRPADQILGHVWRAAMHPEDEPGVAAVMAEARPERRPYGFEARFRRVDGAWRWMRVSVNPRFDAAGAFLGYVGLSFDVTDTVEALDALRESEQRFRAVADTAPVLIWVTQDDRTRAFVNQAYVAFHGGTYEEARLADWRAVVHPDDQAHILAESVAGEATGRPFSMEARYLRHDGEYRWLKSFSRPRLGVGGAVVGFVGVAFDVSEAKQAQDDLRRINDLLEDRVGEALAEKAKAEADLMHAQKMEAVGRLTGGVAHDFNNLLTVVIGALDMMLRSPDDAARQKKLGEAALAAARRGEGLTHQLLAFSRRQALRPEALDLNAQIKHSEPLLKRAVGEAVEFRLKLQRGKVQAHVDPSQFEAALLNLVVNARDAVGDKRTGRIRVETLSCTVAVGEAPELPAGDYVCVVVSDNGVGMDLAVIGRVFEPFFTTKAVGKGTGLGLSQVYGFARQSGGGVAIASTPGKGTDIRLYLPPLDDPGAPAPEQEEEDLDRSGVAGRSLLLVEDDEGVAAIALEQLRSLGLRVQAAETAPQALEKLKAERFDLMLSDVVMPGGMTGIELARECERLYPAMKVVLTSGYAGDDVDAALADAPWPFLRKPYSGQQLADILGDQRVADPA